MSLPAAAAAAAAADPRLQAMQAAAAALQRARPSLLVYDRRRKAEWALRLQQRWLRHAAAAAAVAVCLQCSAGPLILSR